MTRMAFGILLLVAIGAGIGLWLVAGSTGASGPNIALGSLAAYGPPGYRFEARFATRPRCTVDIYHSRQCEDTKWERYTFLVIVTKLSAIPARFRPSDLIGRTQGVIVEFGRSYGEPIRGRRTSIQYASVGDPSRPKQQCSATLLVTDGKTVWDVVTSETFVRVDTEPMTEFLDSFRPIEG